jgi:hypothetical protein
MRLLSQDECTIVAGGTGEETLYYSETDESGGTTGKNNNGYGNGAESGPPPGRSGAHNPQLTGPNSGPRGDR